MTLTTKLEAIEKLREIREKTASTEVESSTRARDLAEATASGFEERLRMQTETVRAQETQVYEEIRGKVVSPEKFQDLHSRIESKNAKLDLFAEQCGKAKNAAASAGERAERAKAKYARVFRAKEKWGAIMKRETERSQKAEHYREELMIEDSLSPFRTVR